MSTQQIISKKDYKLGRHIQKVRKSKGITQEELARKIRVSQTWIAYLETGRDTPNIRMLERIAKALHVKARDLLPF